MTPLGIGLIRYIALGGEQVRGSQHYSGLSAPTTATYSAGETVEFLLDNGYSVLDYHQTDHIIGSNRTQGAYALPSLPGSNKTYRMELQFVYDETTNSDLVAFESMQNAAISGTLLFWYPDYTNYPTEYLVCSVSKLNDPQRNGVYFTATLDFNLVVTTLSAPDAYVAPGIYSLKVTNSTGQPGNVVSTSVNSGISNTNLTLIFAYKLTTGSTTATTNYLPEIPFGISVYANTSSGVSAATLTVSLHAAGAANADAYAVTTSTVDLSVWHTFIAVYDGSGSTDADKMKLYIDGVQVALGTVANAPIQSSLPFLVSSAQLQPVLYDVYLTPHLAHVDECGIVSGSTPDVTLLHSGMSSHTLYKNAPANLIALWGFEQTMNEMLGTGGSLSGTPTYELDVM